MSRLATGVSWAGRLELDHAAHYLRRAGRQVSRNFRQLGAQPEENNPSILGPGNYVSRPLVTYICRSSVAGKAQQNEYSR